MPLHDYRCSNLNCRQVSEHFVDWTQNIVECPQCGSEAARVFLVSAKPNWLALAQGENASPEAIERFDRMHRQQTEKETKCYEEHGDYGPRPGA